VTQLGRALVVVLVGLVLPAECWADWTRIETPNFTFIGDASEGQVRRTAEKLEQFRDVILRVLPNATGVSPKPTVVFVFRRDASLTPFKPTFEGRLTDVAGYFVQTDVANYIAFDAGADDRGFATIFHEYSHFLIDNTLGDLPPWAGEGLAQFFETFEERDGGRVAIVGTPIQDHLRLMNVVDLLPMRDLVAIEHGSADYHEGDRRGVFYAQSWALVHYLRLESRERDGQLDAYLAALGAGVPPEQAFREAFGEPGLFDAELRAYTRQVALPFRRYDLGERAADVLTGAAERLSERDAEVSLAELQAAVGRSDEARGRLERILAADPDDPRALSALGLIDLREGQVGAALARLQRAEAGAPDDGAVQSALGRALVAQLEALAPGDEGFLPTLQRARGVLRTAVTLEPGVAHTAALAGFVELLAGQDLDLAESRLSSAIERAPARDDYRLMLAQVHLRRMDLDRATGLLGPLLARGSSEEFRERARQLLAVVAEARATPSAPAPDGVAPGGSALQLDLRSPQPGEVRVLGTFSRVECRDGLITFVVETDTRTWRLRRNPDREPTLRSYGPSPVLGCGTLDGAFRVLATYVASTSTPPDDGAFDADAVAIEIVPDGFRLP
jgi:Tfp pilus assembly protein PilF